jgi:hypothetical protein
MDESAFLKVTTAYSERMLMHRSSNIGRDLSIIDSHHLNS